MWHAENLTHADGRWVMRTIQTLNVTYVKGEASNTHPAFVWAGPRPSAEEVYSLKY